VAAHGAGVVVGEPGIGKTRLATEARAAVAGERRVLYGRCRDLVGDPYVPLREMFGEVAEEQPDTVAAAVARAAGSEPTALFFDDVHWAEPAFVQVLELLPDALAGLPVALIAFSRAEGPDLGWQQLALRALDAEQTQALIVGLGEQPEVAARLAEQVHARAAGNPLFVEQLFASGACSRRQRSSTRTSTPACCAGCCPRLGTSTPALTRSGSAACCAARTAPSASRTR
jgi:predicted ATPase